MQWKASSKPCRHAINCGLHKTFAVISCMISPLLPQVHSCPHKEPITMPQVRRGAWRKLRRATQRRCGQRPRRPRCWPGRVAATAAAVAAQRMMQLAPVTALRLQRKAVQRMVAAPAVQRMTQLPSGCQAAWCAAPAAGRRWCASLHRRQGCAYYIICSRRLAVDVHQLG